MHNPQGVWSILWNRGLMIKIHRVDFYRIDIIGRIYIILFLSHEKRKIQIQTLTYINLSIPDRQYKI